MLRVFSNPLTFILSLLNLVPGSGLIALGWVLYTDYESHSVGLIFGIPGAALTVMLVPDIYRAACVTSHRALTFGLAAATCAALSVLGYAAFISIDGALTDLPRLILLVAAIATLGAALFFGARADAYIAKSREV